MRCRRLERETDFPLPPPPHYAFVLFGPNVERFFFRSTALRSVGSDVVALLHWEDNARALDGGSRARDWGGGGGGSATSSHV